MDPEKQLVVRRVKFCVTREEGSDRVQHGRPRKSRRVSKQRSRDGEAERLASEMQDERENEKQSIWYAVRFHEEGRELCDMHNLEDGKQENRSQRKKICEMGVQCNQDTREKRIR